MVKNILSKLFNTKNSTYISFFLFLLLLVVAIIVSIKFFPLNTWIIVCLFILSIAESYLLSNLPYLGIGIGAIVQLLLGIYTGMVILTLLTIAIYFSFLWVLHLKRLSSQS